MSEFLALAERCERATGYDAWLNGKIAEAVGWSLSFRPDYADDEAMVDVWTSPDGERSRSTPPSFTASLDAAMSLVPEGWEWALENTGGDTFGPFVAKFGQLRDIEAKTLPLAICAAALRARASQPTNTQERG